LSSYRFCRTDDLPLLAQAYNACYRPHYPGRPEMTVEDLKSATRVWNLWASSCMLALEGSAPVGVLLAAKRDDSSLIWRVGVHPDHQRRGHARHLLVSLRDKLAILGPPLLRAELPAEWTEARRFIEACGYREAVRYTDFSRGPSAEPAEAHPLVHEVSPVDLRDAGALSTTAPRCWARETRTILNRRAEVRALAVAPGERVEASLLYHDAGTDGPREILGLECADARRADTLLGLLVGQACGGTGREVRMRRVDPRETDFGRLRGWGFEPGGETVGYQTDASLDG